MTLPKNAVELAGTFKQLPDPRKADILSHLAHVPESRGQAVVDQMIKNGGPEAAFVCHVLGRQLPKQKTS